MTEDFLLFTKAVTESDFSKVAGLTLVRLLSLENIFLNIFQEF